MLWVKKSKEINAAFKAALEPFLAASLPETDAGQAASDLMRALRFDLSRSATRLRRRLYGMFRSPLVLVELVRLGEDGWGLRPPEKEPDTVGDVVMDPFRVLSNFRVWGSANQRMSAPDRVVAFRVVFNALLSVTKSGQAPMTDAEAGALLAMHANEGGKKVKKDAVSPGIVRHFPSWGLQTPDAAGIEALLASLQTRGFVKPMEDKAMWRLTEEVRVEF
ncbi:MAG: hypothetical protein HY904_23535 [Deltaproteobacteria bacterium]|nr:hypothetical protein [Deltaproteobacteria bacterium]